MPAPIYLRPSIIAAHLVLSGYGTWLSNDPRGSGSDETRKDELDDLGPVHFGRKPDQPSRDELRDFYREADGRLDFPTFWFREPVRGAIGKAFRDVAHARGYTVWACAVCSNHAHLLVRTHRDDAVTMWDAFANGARRAVLALPAEQVGLELDPAHPVWASRPYKVFLHAPPQVRGRIGYIRKNPLKEGLPEQHWDFVVPYDGWPHHQRRKGH